MIFETSGPLQARVLNGGISDLYGKYIYADGDAVFEAKSAFLCTASAAEVGEDHPRGGGTRSGPQSLPRSVKKLAREGEGDWEGKGMRHVMQETCPPARQIW